VDLTQYVAGPYATMVLADLGAEVVKVERPGGDAYRAQGPVFAGGESASFLTLNRGKRSVVLDLRDPGDRERLHGLLDGADVLVENSTPGAMARLGLDWAAVHERHPRLVYCSISGFGQDGGDARRGAYDLTVQALSGLLAMTGHPGGPPAKIPVAALDFGSGLYAVVGVLAALHARERTGTGEWVTASILGTSLAWLSMHVVTHLLGGEIPGPLGTRSPFFAPYEAYRTRDGHLVVVGTGGRDGWRAFCRALGVDRLAEDPRFATNADRVRNAEPLREEVEAVVGGETSAHWASVLEAAGVPAAPVRDLAAALDSPQVRALGLLGAQDHPAAGETPMVRLPIGLSGHPTTAERPPPQLDADRSLLLVPDGDDAGNRR
jgi:CoA:oxalate CoA-transferase